MRASRFFLDELLATPVKPLFVTPTMCYTQNRGIGFPASPNAPSIDDLRDSLTWPETKGIEEISPELMLYQNQRDRALLSLMEEALDMGKVIQGHSAGMTDEKITNAPGSPPESCTTTRSSTPRRPAVKPSSASGS